MTIHQHATRPAARSAPNRFAAIALTMATAYTALRLWWQVSTQPSELSPVGTDLVLTSGWGTVGLCAAAAMLAGVLVVRPVSGVPAHAVRITAAAVGLAMVTAGAMLLLDVVGGVLPGLGIEFYPLGALSRTVCVGSGLALLLAVRSDLLAARPTCRTCRRLWAMTGAIDHMPRWAYAAAYVSVAGCVLRIGAQAAVGFDRSPLSAGASALLFDLGFVLAGSLLPLAQVHQFGRIWPQWVPGLRGRRVPRPLVLWPGIAVSGSMTVYFGFMQIQMIIERLNGRNPFPPSDGMGDLPEAFFWVAIPGYLIWAAALAMASLAHHRHTKRRCATCAL